MSLLACTGTRLRLIAVTDGEASHPGHRDPAALVRRRAQERTEARLALGAADAEVLRLGLPDSGLTGREHDIASSLRNLMTRFGVCLAPWEDDVHADHEAVGRAARQAGLPTFFYPVWMWHWARPARAPGIRLRRRGLPARPGAVCSAGHRARLMVLARRGERRQRASARSSCALDMLERPLMSRFLASA